MPAPVEPGLAGSVALRAGHDPAVWRCPNRTARPRKIFVQAVRVTSGLLGNCLEVTPLKSKLCARTGLLRIMPPKIEQWFFAHHGRIRQRERGITEDQIKDAVLTGRSWIQGKGARGGVKWAFEKVIDRDTLRVAGEVKANAIYIVTAFWVGK